MTSRIFIILAFFLVSCNDDPISMSLTLDEMIEGKWVVSNPIGIAIENDQVTFSPDGSGIGTSKGSFYEETMNSTSYFFTWQTSSFDTVLIVKFENGVERTFPILSIEDEQMILDAQISNWTLDR